MKTFYRISTTFKRGTLTFAQALSAVTAGRSNLRAVARHALSPKDRPSALVSIHSAAAPSASPDSKGTGKTPSASKSATNPRISAPPARLFWIVSERLTVEIAERSSIGSTSCAPRSSCNQASSAEASSKYSTFERSTIRLPHEPLHAVLRSTHPQVSCLRERW